MFWASYKDYYGKVHEGMVTGWVVDRGIYGMMVVGDEVHTVSYADLKFIRWSSGV